MSKGDSVTSGPWTNVYGLGRSVLALGSLLTLLANDYDRLFRPVGKTVLDTAPVEILNWNFFMLLRGQPSLARWLAIALFAVVAIGWRPRLTGLLHAWVASSLASACLILDGGDQIAAVLSVLMLPVTLTDGRRWHWSDPVPARVGRSWAARIALADSARQMVRLQVAFIYFHAAFEKFGAKEWRNGTAAYYWFTNSTVGMPTWLMPAAEGLSHGPVVVAVTWGTLLLETVLFMALVMVPAWRKKLVLPALGFHFSIVLVFGLFSFFFSMAAAAFLLLWPWDEQLQLRAGADRIRTWPGRLIRRMRRREDAILEGDVARA